MIAGHKHAAQLSSRIGRAASWAVLVVVLAAGGACERAGGTHARPSTPALDQPAGRVVSTMPSTTEMLAAIGAWDTVVGVSMYCDTPPEARSLPDIGSGMQPDLERLLALEPDLVVGTVAQRGYDFVAALEGAGIPVLLVPDRSLAEVYDGMRALGRAVGHEAEAERAVARMRAQLDAVRASVAGLGPRRTLLVYDHDPIYAAGPHTMVSELLEVAGGTNVVTSGDWVQLDREQVIQLAPEVILETGLLSDEEVRRAWAPLTTVPAVRDGRIYPLRARALSRPGPGAPEAAREMAARLYPERAGSEAP